MPARKRQLVIVDPDAFYAGIFARRFEAGRWAVRVAESEAEARKLLAKKLPDAMLVDVGELPGGMAFVKALEEDPQTAGVTVVALTDLGDRESIRRCQEAGADGYLLKGHFVPSEVREKLERLVEAAKESV